LQRIKDWVAGGGQRREIAILYRSNAQSRVFEEAFLSARIPYKVYGGLRFFERAEIEDALAYLRLIANRHDDTSFERVVNLPTRGIGAKSVDLLRERARTDGTSLWTAATVCSANGALGAKAAAAVQGFLQLIERMAHDTSGLALHEIVDQMLNASGLLEHYRKEKAERGEARVDNSLELVSAARGFEPDRVDGEPMPPLESFLAHAVLESGEGQAEAWEDWCTDDDAAHCERSRVPGRVFVGDGRRALSASALAQRSRQSRRRAPTRLMSAPRARCSTSTSPMPSSVAYTASTVLGSRRASSRKSPKNYSKKFDRASMRRGFGAGGYGGGEHSLRSGPSALRDESAAPGLKARSAREPPEIRRAA
jgi:hypothetical protein